MLFRDFIIYLTIFIWVIIPFRQFRTRFFGYFLALAVMDLVLFTIDLFIPLNSYYYYLYGTIIVLYATLFTFKRNSKIIIVLVLFLFVSIIMFYFPEYAALSQIPLHIIITVLFLKVLVVYYSKNRKLLLFHLLLVVYEFSIILKFFVIYGDKRIIIPYFLLTNVFEMFMTINLR